jgi:hypothetical protein
MTKKLEEVFDLDSFENDVDSFDAESPVPDYDFDELQGILSEIDKIDQALPTVRGLEAMDAEMDDIKRRSLKCFDEIMDYGKNVEDKLAAGLFDSAAKMLNSAITANQSKMDRKLKAIQLQIQKSKQDLERDKLEWKKEEARLAGDFAKPINGTVEEIKISRNELIAQIIKQSKDSQS